MQPLRVNTGGSTTSEHTRSGNVGKMTEITMQRGGDLLRLIGRKPLEVDYLGRVERYGIEIETDEATVVVYLSQREAVGLLVGLRTAIASAEEYQEEERRQSQIEQANIRQIRRLRDAG